MRKSKFQTFEINREIIMLVLSRKLGEKIVIGDNIVVTVVKIDRNQIRIGIEAPSDVPVYREEIAPQRSSAASPGAVGRFDRLIVRRTEFIPLQRPAMFPAGSGDFPCMRWRASDLRGAPISPGGESVRFMRVD